MNPTNPPAVPGWPPWRHALLVGLVWAAVYLPGLGVGGLTSTEGHRAIPGWAMLESGDWKLPRLFGQIYLRKPPGMSWAVAASSGVLGETEFAARLPSALAMLGMSLCAMTFGARWFGRGCGLAAGLATALTPLFWSSGRSAEIEALNNFATSASVLLVLDLCLGLARPATRSLMAGLLVAALFATALAKGPAGFAAIGTAVAVGLVMSRGRAFVWLVAAFLVAGLWVGLTAGVISRALEASGEQAITQGVSEFLWAGRPLTIGAVGSVLAMAPVALITMLPASLGLLLPWGPDARGEGARDSESASALRFAKALSWTCVVSLIILMLSGVNNPRYAMPSMCFLPVLAAYAWRGAQHGFVPLRALIAHWMFLRKGWAWPVVLLIGAAAFIGWIEPRHRATSGREAGRSLGAALPSGIMVWADHMIEARPEVLWYARKAAGERGDAVRPVWVPGMASMLSLPRSGTYLLLRTEAGSSEESDYRKAGVLEHWERVWTGRVHKFECALYRMRPTGAP